MIIVTDIGNTHIVVGAYDGDNLLFSARIATDRSRTEYQYAVEIDSIFRMMNAREHVYSVAVISCVVPPLLPTIKNALGLLFNCRVLAVGPGIKTGLNIRIDNPSVLGSDMVCSAVAAIKKYGAPCVIIDLGTATKISAVDSSGSFIGCSIMPGVGVSLEALSSKTAQLPFIDIEQVNSVIGTNSVDSMRSGVIYGSAAMIDGMLERYRDILGENAAAVATGGFSADIIPFCKTKIQIDPKLILDGLNIICKKNG